MGRLPSLTSRDLVRFLSSQGFAFVRQSGSHATYRHPDGRATVVPVHSGDVAPVTAESILKQAGFTVSDFLRLR